LIEELATERGYTLEELADELEARGWPVGLEGEETIDALRSPVYCSNVALSVALEDVLDLSSEQYDSLRRALREDVKEVRRRWGASA
jgi:hypothetical protein